MTDDVTHLESQLAATRAKHIVPLQRYADLQAALGRAQAAALITSLTDELAQLSEELFDLQSSMLINWVSRLCEEFGVPEKHSVAWMRDWLVERPAFWRMSSRVRHYYAEFAEVPYAEVLGHVRDGRKVRKHVRLLGYEHLLAMKGCESVVAEVFRVVVERARRRG